MTDPSGLIRKKSHPAASLLERHRLEFELAEPMAVVCALIVGERSVVVEGTLIVKGQPCVIIYLFFLLPVICTTAAILGKPLRPSGGQAGVSDLRGGS